MISILSFCYATTFRKLKKPETSGPIGNFAPRPPSDKSAWNSPRNSELSSTTPNGINHTYKDDEPPGEEIDPFTGEVKKSRKKKKDPFTSTLNESVSPREVEDEFEEKMDPFTGEIKRTKKRKDPFTMMNSVDLETKPDDEDKVETNSLTSGRRTTSKGKDPFTAMNSIDLGSPTEVDPLPKEKSRTSNQKDPFTAMNSIDFGSPTPAEELEVNTLPHEKSRTSKQNDRFTAMNSIDLGSPENSEVDPQLEEKGRTFFRQRDPFTAMNSIDFDSSNDNRTDYFTTEDSNNNDEEPENNCGGSNQLKSSVLVEGKRTLEIVNDREINGADDETGEQIFEPRATPDGSDGVEDAFSIAEESVHESSVSTKFHLSDAGDLLKSTDTDLVENKDDALPPLVRPGRLSPLQEQSSQEQSSPERALEVQSNVVEEIDATEYVAETDGEQTTEIQENTSQETEIVNKQEQNIIAEIDTESDSDNLVVIGKPLTPKVEETAVENEPVATSTPLRDEIVSQISKASPVPRLNLEGVIGSDEEPDVPGANDTYTKNTPIRAVNSNEDEDEAIGSGSELGSIGSGTLKANEFVHEGDVSETEAEIVKRKSRTGNISDVRPSSPESGRESGSSGFVKKGRLSPIAPSKPPPPLEDNYTSHVLRTTYKKDDISNSMVLSEPLMRSRDELSDTNRSFLSTGALPQISTKKARNR